MKLRDVALSLALLFSSVAAAQSPKEHEKVKDDYTRDMKEMLDDAASKERGRPWVDDARYVGFLQAEDAGVAKLTMEFERGYQNNMIAAKQGRLANLVAANKGFSRTATDLYNLARTKDLYDLQQNPSISDGIVLASAGIQSVFTIIGAAKEMKLRAEMVKVGEEIAVETYKYQMEWLKGALDAKLQWGDQNTFFLYQKEGRVPATATFDFETGRVVSGDDAPAVETRTREREATPPSMEIGDGAKDEVKVKETKTVAPPKDGIDRMRDMLPP